MSNVKTSMMNLRPGHMVEGDEFGPDANGDYWIEDAYAGYVKKKKDQVDGGIEDAPEDGDLYGRRGADGIEDAAWEKLPLTEFEEEAGRLQGEIDQEKFYRVEEDQKLEAQIAALKDAGVKVSDTPPSSPKEGMLWFNSSENELTLYVYEGSVWVPAAPPVSLDGINATIEAALVVQSDLVDVVTKGIDEQNKLKLDIEELQVTKGSVARYKVTATSIGAASRNGELYVMSPIAVDVQAMSFAPFDLTGQPIKPCNPGDILELVEAVALADVGEVCRYRIVSGDSNALTVEYLSGTNNFEVDETVEVYIYPQNVTGASKDYVDAQNQLLDDRKLNLSGGTLTNSLKFNRGNKPSIQFGIEPNSGTSDTNIYVFNDGQMRLRSSHTDSIDDRVGSHIVLDPNGGVPETKIYHVVTPTNDTMATNKEYCDTKISKEGINELPDAADWKIRQKNSSGSNKTLIQGVSGELGLYNLKEPTESHHAANKGYVDANRGRGISASRPAGLKFMLSIVNLPDGYFNWWTNNSTNNQHLELATTDKDGIAWGTNTLREDVRYSDNVPFTIWEVANNAWKMKVHGTISRIDFHPDRALCYVSSNTALNGGDFVNGAGPYYITISGLF